MPAAPAQASARFPARQALQVPQATATPTLFMRTAGQAASHQAPASTAGKALGAPCSCVTTCTCISKILDHREFGRACRADFSNQPD